jgi:DNA replication and repair protein RecF
MDCRVKPGNDNRDSMTASRIRRLTLTHFRNYRAASVATLADVVTLVGPNCA